MRAAHEREQLLFADLLGGDRRDHLLREDVERLVRRAGSRSSSPARIARTAAAVCTSSSRVSGKKIALRYAAEPVAGAADALEQRRERARRAEVADEIDVADVDAELERGGRDDDRDLAGLELLLGVEPDPAREAAVMRRPRGPSPSRSPSACATRSTSRRVLTKTIVVRCASHELARCGRRSPPAARGSRSRRARGRASRPTARIARRCPASTIAQSGVPSAPTAVAADQQPGDLLDRLLRRREADALQPAAGERVEPLEREREVRAALVAGDGVDLVDDDRAAPCASISGSSRP